MAHEDGHSAAPSLSHAHEAPEPAELGAAQAAPVSEGERVYSIDVLRGVALLGILVMNIVGFAMPHLAYGNPRWAGDLSRADFWTWAVSHVVFDTKMMSIFSMLFGAGVVIFTQRLEERRGSAGGLFYSRMGWLLLIGAAHGYLLWFGDILFTYALCGMLVYFLRRLHPGALISLGVFAALLAMPVSYLNGWAVAEMRDEARAAQVVLDEGGELTEEQDRALSAWADLAAFFEPTPEEIDRQVDIYRGSYIEIVKERAPFVRDIQTQYFLLWGLPRAGGMMLLGMGLYKLGVFSATRSMSFYAAGAAVSYAVGLPVTVYGATEFVAHDFDPVRAFKVDSQYNYAASIVVAFGHVCAVMMMCKLGALRRLQQALAAVGRMALTNYLMQSLIATTLFYGYGFGLFAKLGRFELLGVVAVIWAIQLVVSPWWLRRYQFGPAEWLWRSLTYWRMQPMRRAA